MIIQTTIPYHLIGISYTAVIEVVTNHGGICVYTKDNVFSRRRNDRELPNIECIWIKITVHHRKFLLGTFYRPPNFPAQTLSSVEDSIGLAFDSNINDEFITGDFNLDTLKNTSNQNISAICQQFSVTKMIVEPTHFTDHSSSIIDLIFASNKNSILLSGVGDPFLDQNARYHCPVYFVLIFHKNVAPAFSDILCYLIVVTTNLYLVTFEKLTWNH